MGSVHACMVHHINVRVETVLLSICVAKCSSTICETIDVVCM